MISLIKKCPLPIAGLILGLSALGNLIQSYGSVFKYFLGLISTLLLILFTMKLILFPAQVKEDLKNPVVASVFPTFSMAIMVLSTYFYSYSSYFAFSVWVVGLSIHITLILWFSWNYIKNFNIKKVFPSWFIVYVGIVVASVTAPTYNLQSIGKIAFYFGFITYLILLYYVLYRLVKIKDIVEPALPTLAILAAPASLLLAGYMNSFNDKSMTVVYLLMFMSFIFYGIVISLLPKLLKLSFYPSYSGFTFPLVISGLGMKLSNSFLSGVNKSFFLIEYLVEFQVIVATLITLYVLFRYIKFLGSLIDTKQPAI